MHNKHQQAIKVKINKKQAGVFKILKPEKSALCSSWSEMPRKHIIMCLFHVAGDS